MKKNIRQPFSENVLVIIEYLASMPSGECMYLPGNKVKSTANIDTYEIHYDFKYMLNSVKFTERFQKLKRKTRDKIIKHVLKRLVSGELIKDEECTEYILRYVWDADYFETAKVVKNREMRVEWVEECHIDYLDFRE